MQTACLCKHRIRAVVGYVCGCHRRLCIPSSLSSNKKTGSALDLDCVTPEKSHNAASSHPRTSSNLIAQLAQWSLRVQGCVRVDVLMGQVPSKSLQQTRQCASASLKGCSPHVVSAWFRPREVSES